jgi:lysophospholipase L1-like esterase
MTTVGVAQMASVAELRIAHRIRMAAGAEERKEGVVMSKNHNQQPIKPATKLKDCQKMFRLCSLIGLLATWLSPILEAEEARQEVVIVHFGDSTCITGYLPKDQRVEAVLNRELANFYRHQSIVSHNVAAGGDYIRRFLDNGRYEKVVKDKIPHIDIALIRYGHNDQKHCEPIEFKRHLKEFCDFLWKDYPGVRVVLETNTWVDPEHHSGDQKATIRFNERMNSTWEVVRQLASERKYPLVEIYEQKKKETMARNWDQRIRNQQLSQDKFGRRILDGSKDAEMKVVPGWFVDNHPNANGVKIIADEEFKTITRLWPKGLPTAARK